MAGNPAYNVVPGDIVGEWKIHLPDGIHSVEFEHGTTSGKRVIRVDGKEVIRKGWMFNLVGKETFKIGGKSASILIQSEGLSFTYSITVNGQTLKKFIETQNKHTRTWLPIVKGEPHRIVLDTKTMDIYVDGSLTETVGEFIDGGAENHFELTGAESAFIRTLQSTGTRKKGLLYKLILNGEEHDPVVEVTG
ncbi:PREDICTED: fas apoptotic inhibitory molecule 1-like [Amphimedon queenslandica]|uniref:Fas apoptotic inhibitory molecule 1 n=1 Tax=Amphimedon queenslandica TaxID=400682 RepID=A0A1X7VFA0_AMPQE|nr:PREDICTED: fas apoptotic inhibitory molecule 1-like [Amphimedon queenslandica]|eukprot:XP_003384385.1 PREDICTED: fas apoptotic inhibitory molecule 1-like [Amphimedon queenslandica]